MSRLLLLGSEADCEVEFSVDLSVWRRTGFLTRPWQATRGDGQENPSYSYRRDLAEVLQVFQAAILMATCDIKSSASMSEIGGENSSQSSASRP